MPDRQSDHHPLYWKRKLYAYLHDSPDKVLDIADHERRARRIAGALMDEREDFRREADWTASAADRLPFPKSADTRTRLSRFKHPLGSGEVALSDTDLTVDRAEEISQKSRPVIEESSDPRAAFIATWRLWRNWASSIHPAFALLPAETRLPDHTIWNHLAVTSAMQGCLGGEPWSAQGDRGVADSPCFLVFTIGPVQDFIAAARSTRDLWSGSYLLSYLIATTLKRIALDFGPDHVVFPNLCDQPIIDLLLKEDVWDVIGTGSGNLFQGFDYDSETGKRRLLIPSLPNRFLALLPANMTEHRQRGARFASAETYAKHLEESLRKFFREEIAGAVARVARECFGDRFNGERFNAQVERQLEIHWQVLPWPNTFPEVEALAGQLPPDAPENEFTPRAGLRAVRELCEHGADLRYLEERNGARHPKNVAAGWSALYGVAEWLLDGVKANRGFRAATGGSFEDGASYDKDYLTGREEAVLFVGDQADAEKLSGALAARLRKHHLLKEGETLGAPTLVKRLWPYAFLRKKHDLKPDDLRMPNTRSMAAHRPWDDSDDNEGPESGGDSQSGYFAVLALDGDSMGKWIGGAKTPPLAEVLSKECADVYRRHGADLTRKRPLSPSWHLQFSEALGNFSMHAVRRVVEAFDGRLIYCGGDDVLAMLPANRALECAAALRLAFRGDPALNDAAKGVPADDKGILRSDRATPLFAIDTPGFLKLAPNETTRFGERAALLDDPVRFPVIVPGPAADCSVGIAIAHFKSPLQDVVRAAQAAEKRAKNQFGRAAFAVSLFKRSGEISEWGGRWESGALELYEAVSRALEDEKLAGTFPHRVCRLLDPYLVNSSTLMKEAGALSDATDFDAAAVIRQEFAHAVSRQSADKAAPENTAALLPKLESYLSYLAARGGGPQTLVSSVIGLCVTAAFTRRTNSDPQQPNGNRP